MNLLNRSAVLLKTLVLTSYLLACIHGSIVAQTIDNRILVLGDAFEEVPANQVTLYINLSYNDERDIKLAYQEHQQVQQRLKTLLNQQKVASQDINFLQLLSRKGQNFQRGQSGERFTTYQRVVVKFNDLTHYDQLQEILSTNGFTDLSAVFSVSNQREIESRLLDKALVRAGEKANQLAKATGRSIKRVIRVSDVGENEGFYAYRELSRNNQSTNAVNYDTDAFRQMALIPQVFRYGAGVKVEYELNN